MRKPFNPATEPLWLVRGRGERSDTCKHLTKMQVPYLQIPFPPGRPPLPLTSSFCIHKHNRRGYSTLLLLLLNTNTLKTVHVKCEQAHDNRDHIWRCRNRWTLECMFFLTVLQNDSWVARACKFKMIQYDAVRCAKAWVQRAVNELNLVVNARFDGTRFESWTCDSDTNVQHEYV